VTKKREQEKDSSQKESLLDYFVANGRDASTSTAAISALLTGAVDSTSTTSLWLLYQLSQHPNIQEKLYQELATAIGPDGEVSASNLPSLLKAALNRSRNACILSLGMWFFGFLIETLMSSATIFHLVLIL
jgi:cytochrome P450